MSESIPLEGGTPPTPAHDPSKPLPGIGRLQIPIPPELFEVDDPDLLELALSDAEDARLHLGAMLEILRSVHPAYKIEAGLYLGNLQNIYARLARVIDAITVIQMPI